MTSSPWERRLLLVEDEAQIYRTLERRLRQAGYTVTLATDYATAWRHIETGYFHVAIFDIRLVKSDDQNEDGLNLLRHVDELGLRDVLPCVMLTSYSTLDRALRALQDYHAAGFIEKKPGYIAKLLEKIQAVFNERVQISFGMEFVGQAEAQLAESAEDIHAADTGWPELAVLAPQTRDVVSKLLVDARRLVIRRKFKGLSGSVVLEVHPSWAGGLGRSYVAKIGRRDKTAIEAHNYRHYVENFLAANHATQLHATYTRHLGALLYTLADTEASATQEFEAFYHQRATPDIVVILQQLFRETCYHWYQGRQPPDFANLRDLYLHAFGLQDQPERLAGEIRTLRPDLPPEAPCIHFAAPSLDLPNPLRWLSEDDASLLPVSQCVTHGDLNAHNILISPAGQCWLIDFYRTGPSHILRDFVVLETDIKFRLLNYLAPEAFYALEASLLRWETATSPDDSATPAAHKACRVIAGLRYEARQVLGGMAGAQARQFQREYFVSLLMATLNILRMRHFKETPDLRPRRELALLSAAMLCQRLRELD